MRKPYIAGPITLGGTVLNAHFFIARFHLAEQLLAEAHPDWEILNPIKIPKPEQDCTDPEWVYYMRAAIKMLADADSIILLPDWKLSPGARLEKFIADGLNFPAYEVDVLDKNRCIYVPLVESPEPT